MPPVTNSDSFRQTLFMNKFFNQYADLTALVLALILPLVCTILLKQKAGKKMRAVPAYFLFFGPCGVIIFIFFHLLENSYRAVEGAIAGSFSYSFRFYSLILLGIVVAWAGYKYLIACRNKCLNGPSANRSTLYSILLIFIICGPLIPITPISAAPMICCVISLMGLPFTSRAYLFFQ